MFKKNETLVSCIDISIYIKFYKSSTNTLHLKNNTDEVFL